MPKPSDTSHTLDDYAAGAATTAQYPRTKSDLDSSANVDLLYLALGLTGEAGELANKVKKIVREQAGKATPEQLANLADEAGDVLWYVSELATACGTTLEAVAQANLDKLASRKARGVIGGSGDNR